MKEKLLKLLFSIKASLYRIKNHKEVKVFLYTDSRGFDVTGKLGRIPLNSYADKLIETFNTSYYLCPEKFTTIVDFLNTIGDTWKNYDIVIMHCGIVDFSPRPLSNIKKVKDSKIATPNFDELFKSNADYHNTILGAQYYGEDTITIYSKEYLETVIGPKLASIENLLWIDSNYFVQGWEGNYERGRPSNIQEVVSDYELILKKFVKNSLSIKDWSVGDVKKFTLDNIHFTKSGFNEIYNRLAVFINKGDYSK